MTLKPYTNVYALLDDADEVIRIQKVEFTKGNISELEAKYGKHLRLGVLVLDPMLISLLPLKPEVYTADPSKVLGDVSKLHIHLAKSDDYQLLSDFALCIALHFIICIALYNLHCTLCR